MAAKGGTEANIEPGLVARAMRGLRYAFTGQADWFGPGQPLNPSAPAVIEGRQYDLPISVNTVNSTKIEGIAFRDLRQFSDACDVVRLLIETRKDQVCGLSWVIRSKDGEQTAQRFGAKPKKDKRIDDLTTFFRRPDKDHGWSEWLRLLLEDMFVVDAASVYVQRTNGGEIYALRPIDGATIKRIIDTHGWTPLAPQPAYQQILKGTIALDYTTDDLIYRPRNPRTNHIYGYGHVEQVIVTAKLLLMRQASNLEYYETGNLPEGWITVADGWTPQQLKEYQDILDAQLSGNLAERRKARAAPAGSKWQAVKEPALKDEYDEWLARIACFAFSYPPTPFIKQMNRSTSDNAKQSADEEGVQPITRWVKELIDDIIQNRMGYDDLEFGFEDKEAQDPLERAQIDQIYVNCGVLEPNEVRAEMGLDPLPEPVESTPVMLNTLVPAGTGQSQPGAPTDAVPALPNGKPVMAPGAKPTAKPVATKAAAKPAQKMAKMGAGDGSKDAPKQTPEETAAETELADEIAAALDLTAEQVAEQVASAESRGSLALEAQAMADQVDLTPIAQAYDALQESITEAASDGAEHAMVELAIASPDMTNLVNTRAVDWAAQRAGALITADGSGGALLDATRDLIRQTIEQAVTEGWSAQELARELRGSYAFSRQRAMTIARTELIGAYNNGALQGYITSGVVKGKRWIRDPDPCPICIANAEQGEIPLLQAFQGGTMTAPQHPNCRCTVSPVVD